MVDTKLPARPYPLQYVSPWTMRDGTQVIIRPIRPDDEPMMIKFHGTLSDRTVYLRYFCSLSLNRRITHERLLRICAADHEREMVLVVEQKNPQQSGANIIAVGRLNRFESTNDAEIAVLVADPHQGHGLGTELLRRLIQIARDEKLTSIVAETLHDNIAIQVIFKKLGFTLRGVKEDPNSVQATLKL